MAKYYPIQNKMELESTSASATGQLRVDRLLSRANRRLYREGRVYQVKLDLDVSSAVAGNYVNVYALKNTWMNHKAWQMAFQEYLNATKPERDRAGKTRLARWNDFRVKTGVTAVGLNAIHFDEDLSGDSQIGGEFELSQITDSSNVNREFTWSGSPTGLEFGILTEYGKQGGPNQHPTSPGSDQPYSEMDGDSSNAEYDDVTDHGNLPPYETNVESTYPFTQVATLSIDPGAQKMSTGFFDAPCGIVIVTGLNAQAVQRLTMTAKLGDYKGVHAPRMFHEIKTEGDDVKVV